MVFVSKFQRNNGVAYFSIGSAIREIVYRLRIALSWNKIKSSYIECWVYFLVKLFIFVANLINASLLYFTFNGIKVITNQIRLELEIPDTLTARLIKL